MNFGFKQIYSHENARINNITQRTMKYPFLRFISAIVLSIVTSLAIRTICMVCFTGFVNFFVHFGFKTLFYTSIACSVGGGLITFIVPLLLMGLHWAGNGSKWIAALPIFIFFNYFIGDCLYLFTDDIYHGVYSVELMTFLREEAGWFYMPGAILTTIVMLISYVAASAALLTKENF